MRVVDVWAHNQDQELARIRELARGFPIAAVAVSHEGPPAFLLSGQTFPHTLEGNYEAVRASVERATSAQVGLALASRDGELAMGGRVWRFHLGAGAGLANPRRVCLGIRAHARATMPRGALVTSDGAEDAAYLIRHIVDGGLPRRRDEFLRACGVCFPALYDLRVLEIGDQIPSARRSPASQGSVPATTKPQGGRYSEYRPGVDGISNTVHP